VGGNDKNDVLCRVIEHASCSFASISGLSDNGLVSHGERNVISASGETDRFQCFEHTASNRQ